MPTNISSSHEAIGVGTQLGRYRLVERIGHERIILRACQVALTAACLAAPIRALGAQITLADSARSLDRDAQAAYGKNARPERDRAVQLWTVARALLERSGDETGVARMYWRIGAAQFANGQLDSAALNLREAIARARKTNAADVESNALYDLGMLHGQASRWDSAMVAFRRALGLKTESRDTTRLTRIHAGIAALHRQAGRPDSARAHFAIIVDRVHGDPDRYFVAKVLTEVGLLHGWAGRIDSALAYAREVGTLYREIGDKQGESGALGAIAMAYSALGRMDSAKVYYQRSLDISRGISDTLTQAKVAGNVAILSDNVDSAIVRLRIAVSLARASRDSAVETNVLSALGAAHAIAGHRDSALFNMRRSLVLLPALKLPLDSAFIYQAAGQTWHDLGFPDSALVYLGLALRLRRTMQDPWGEALLYHAIGVVHHRSPRIRNLPRARAYYDSSSVAVGALRKFTAGDNNLISFNELADSLFGDWTLAWLANAQPPGRGRSAQAALAAAERGRAQALLGLMRDTAVRTTAGGDLRSEGSRLVSELRRSSAAGLIYLITKDTLVTWLVPSSGAVEVFRHGIARDHLAALVGGFRNGLGAENGSARLGLRAAPLELVTVRPADMRTVADSPRPAEELAAILLPPQVMRRLESEKEVVIVPQGALSLVPFAGLPVGRAGEPFGTKLAIRYAPSLGTLGHAEERSGLGRGDARDRALKRALVVGNPRMPEVRVSDGTRDRLTSLPGAEAESRGIATQLGTTALTGAGATETEVVRRLSSAPLVHLATHGFAYSTEAKARSSFVALAPDSMNDGLLTVGKILDNSLLKLTAELVVLSACQTALGDLKQAEGTVGLQRAFLAKGARSVLVSLWNVSDAATRTLMSGFYRHWLRDADHPSKAEALRRSQEEVRKIPGFEHPRFWAAFQLVGAR